MYNLYIIKKKNWNLNSVENYFLIIIILLVYCSYLLKNMKNKQYFIFKNKVISNFKRRNIQLYKIKSKRLDPKVLSAFESINC